MLKCGFNLKTQTKFALAIAWRESVLSELTPIVWCQHRGKAECSPTAVATEDLHSQCAHPSVPQHSSLPSVPQHQHQPPVPFCLMFPAQVQLLLAYTLHFSYAQKVLPTHNYFSPILFQYSFDFPPLPLYSVNGINLVYNLPSLSIFCLYIKFTETYKKYPPHNNCAHHFETVSSCLTVCRVHCLSVGIYLITLFSIKFCSVECNR